ncbi:hypothetical protein R5W60_06820 [Brucella pseudintermedia]|uniref:hypothetical protein n=1 Tax=Brucella pseudintermedia TaxID=370111 RepID=UPI00366EBD35|nr:hypothetical protein R5W60_06820 [Brucella pseudintermedia]
MNIVDVVALKWLDPEHTMLGGTAVTTEFGPVPVCIRENYDTEEGRILWNDAQAGKYGPIFDFKAPPEPTPEESREAMPALTARQFWKAALEIDITEDSMVTEMADPSSPCFVSDEKERQDAIVDIRKATTFERTYPTLNKLATAKGIPPEQLDSLWSWAALQEK